VPNTHNGYLVQFVQPDSAGTTLQTGRPSSPFLCLQKAETFSIKLSDFLQNSFAPLLNGHLQPFPRGYIGRSMELTTDLHLMQWSSTPVPVPVSKARPGTILTLLFPWLVMTVRAQLSGIGECVEGLVKSTL